MNTIRLVLPLAALIGLAAHEGGHYAAGRLLGYRCTFGFGWLGPYTIIGADLEPGQIVGWQARLVAAAGPAVNLMIFAAAYELGEPWVAFAQLDMLLLAGLRDYRNILKGLSPSKALRAPWRAASGIRRGIARVAATGRRARRRGVLVG